MADLNTARGPIDTADLGVTLMHEHVFVLSPEILQNYPEVWGDEARREADAIARLTALKARGVDSIVDLTVIGTGRYIPRIARIAAATELNIVVATGVYTYNDVPLHFHLTGPGTRVVIGHCGDTTDLGYLEELIANGSYLGMDRFGLDAFLPFEDRVNTVATLCERGHADRMVLSHDAACLIDWLPEAAVPVALPNWHYLHIHDDVLPALQQRGVTDEQITTMLVDNPRRIFERRGTY